MERLGHVVLRERRGGIARFQGEAKKHGVIGDGIKIQGRGHLNLIARRVVNRLTLSKSVCVVGRGGCAEVVGVKGVLGVYMQIAEIRIAKRVRRRRRAIDHIHDRFEGVTTATTKVAVLVN